MTVHLTTIQTIPKPEGAAPFVVSSNTFIRLAYPVSRSFPVTTEIIEPLGNRTADSIQAFFNPKWPYRVFENDWLYAICESGISCGYQTTYEHGLQHHPLIEKGLTPQEVFEISNSPWKNELQRSISALESHLAPQLKLKHYLFAFDDTVFECMTSHFLVEYVFGSRYEVSADMAASTKWGQ